MGEDAIRKSDGVKIKIGTCESMYYLRYEDRDKVSKAPNSLDPSTDAIGLFFRLPFPDEDAILPGEYQDYHRGLCLYRIVHDIGGFGPQLESTHREFFEDELAAKAPGTIQLHHPASGLLVKVPCYHGIHLPDLGPAKACWNGKGYAFELAHLKPTTDGVLPIVRCRFCGSMWRYQWADVMDYIESDMRARLEGYARETVAA